MMPEIVTKNWRLTGAQSGMWYAQQLDPNNPIFNAAEYVVIEGPVDPLRFEQAVRLAVREADSLHLRFGEDQEGPWQRLNRSDDWTFHMIDVSHEQNPLSSANAWMEEDRLSPVDLKTDALFTQTLFKLANDRYVWYLRIHHIVMDGYGFSLLRQRVANIYTALMNNASFEQGTFQSFESLLEEDQAYHISEKYEQDKDFWLKRIEHYPEVVSLTDKAPRITKTFYRQKTSLSSGCVERMKRIHHRTMGWQEVFIAAVAAYIHRLTNSEQVVIGLPMMCRLGSASLNVPAMVMNVVPLCVSVRPDMSVSELTDQVIDELDVIRRHQYYRHEELKRELKLIGQKGRLFGPLVNILPFDFGLNFAGYQGKTYHLSAGPVDDLSIHVYDRLDGSGIHIDMDANPECYTETQLTKHIQRFTQFLHLISDSKTETVIGQLEMLLPEEREKVQHLWNRTERSLPDKTVTQWIEEQVERNPHAEAVVCGDECLSYQQLDECANQLANLLASTGLEPERYVALALPRSSHLITSMLAVLKCGAAYLPLDPDYPSDRIRYMIETTQPSCIITSKSIANRLPDIEKVSLIVLDDPETKVTLEQQKKIFSTNYNRVSMLHPAYVIYTSGSTGKPKGVVVTMQGLVNFLASMHHRFALCAQDRLLAVTTVAFDISALEIFLPLISGATVVMADKETVQDPMRLADVITRHQVSVMQATPTLWQNVLSCKPQCLHGIRILVGGEALPSHLLQSLYTYAEDVTNLYGPTETTIWSTAAKLDRTDQGTPSIGKPIWNTQVYILDANLKPVPPGVPGDLYIAGSGLARGYQGRASLTAERFVANPYGQPGTRMYRTGDIVRWLEDGSLDYICRADHQVKVRGFRIELGEIESVLVRHPNVVRAAVIVREDIPGDKRLTAYVVTDDQTLNIAELREHVRSTVPEYMVPSAVVTVSELPLTPNGKLDRKALPAPDMTIHRSGRDARTPQEEILCGLFAEILGLPRVGIDDNFFELGGHSLLAGRLVGRVRDVLGVHLEIGQLFEAPTVSGVLQYVDQVAEGRPLLHPVLPYARPSNIPLSLNQRRLWFLHCMEGPNPAYNIPMVLDMTGTLNREALYEAICDVVERHEILRTIFPENDGDAHQIILDAKTVKPVIKMVDVDQASLSQNIHEAARYVFDITKEPSFRAQLFSVNQNKHALLLLMHHIVSDGWSLNPLCNDVAAAYAARLKGKTPAWKPLPIQYADFALWQQENAGTEGKVHRLFANQLDYWRHTLKGLPEQLDLPGEVKEGDIHDGKTIKVHIHRDLHRRLSKLAQDHKASLFMVIQTAFSALLTRLGAGTDIPFGCPIAGRHDDALDDLIGFFVNTIVLRMDTSGNPSFRALLERVRKVNLSAYANQDLPFDRLVEELNPTRAKGRNPLFQVMVAFQSTPEVVVDMPGLSTEMKLINVESPKFDLTLELSEKRSEDGSPGGIEGIFEYRTSMFHRQDIERMIARLLNILEAVVENPDLSIGNIDLLMPDERYEMENDVKQLTPCVTLVDLFESQTKHRPESIAVTYGDTQITYAELNKKANRIAHLLISKGVGPETIVALAMPRSTDMIACLLAVLKAGGAYLPLDPNYPKERIAYMLNDANPVCILTMKEIASDISISACVQKVILDDPDTMSELASQPVSNPENTDRSATLDPFHPAYIIYTSGSTGNPKGVVIPHQNVVRLLDETRSVVQILPRRCMDVISFLCI